MSQGTCNNNNNKKKNNKNNNNQNHNHNNNSSEINSLSWCVESCNSPLLEAVYKEEVLRCYAKSCEAASLQRERKERFQEKQLCGQFWRHTAEVRDKNVKDLGVNEKGQTKEGQTEGMIRTAQDQALRTNVIKRIICRGSDETISHVFYQNATSLLKSDVSCWRHDKVMRVIHWDLSIRKARL